MRLEPGVFRPAPVLTWDKLILTPDLTLFWLRLRPFAKSGLGSSKKDRLKNPVIRYFFISKNCVRFYKQNRYPLTWTELSMDEADQAAEDLPLPLLVSLC